MTRNWNQHIGDDQLAYGMPKHMSAIAGGGDATDSDQMKTYWRYHPKPQACDKCQAMKGLWFEKRPGPVHPNCKCEVEEFKAIKVTGRFEAIIVPPNVDIAANIAEARRVAKGCEAKAQKITSLSSGHYAEGQVAFLLKCWWIYDKFKSGADYDFKKGGTYPEYEDFGNYHYGLYTRAMGINVTFAQAAAGAWQLKQGTSEWTNPEFIKNWLDDPRDNRRIREGQQYPLD